MLNDRQLLKVVEQITGSGKIGSFHGTIYRMTLTHGHSDTWHNDLIDHRLVALSINLSTDVYAGGLLQLRDVKRDRIINEIANTGFGDALISRLAPWLTHKVKEVEGPVEKMAMAGWFKSEPDFQADIADNLLRMRNRPRG